MSSRLRRNRVQSPRGPVLTQDNVTPRTPCLDVGGGVQVPGVNTQGYRTVSEGPILSQVDPWVLYVSSRRKPRTKMGRGEEELGPPWVSDGVTVPDGSSVDRDVVRFVSSVSDLRPRRAKGRYPSQGHERHTGDDPQLPSLVPTSRVPSDFWMGDRGWTSVPQRRGLPHPFRVRPPGTPTVVFPVVRTPQKTAVPTGTVDIRETPVFGPDGR